MRWLIAATVLVACASPAWAATTRLELSSERGDRLEVGGYSGRVELRVWDEPRIVVVARSDRKEPITLERSGRNVTLRAASWTEPAGSFALESQERAVLRLRGVVPQRIDYEITTPSWLELRVAGPQLDVSAVAIAAPVAIETFTSSLELSDIEGPVQIATLGGSVELRNVNGRVRLEVGAANVLAADGSGAVEIETVAGTVALRSWESDDVLISTVSGAVSWKGPLLPDGNYALSSHSGDINVELPPGTSATATLRTHEGQITSGFERTQEGATDIGFSLGSGGAALTLESFSGTVSLIPARD